MTVLYRPSQVVIRPIEAIPRGSGPCGAGSDGGPSVHTGDWTLLSHLDSFLPRCVLAIASSLRFGTTTISTPAEASPLELFYPQGPTHTWNSPPVSYLRRDRHSALETPISLKSVSFQVRSAHHPRPIGIQDANLWEEDRGITSVRFSQTWSRV